MCFFGVESAGSERGGLVGVGGVWRILGGFWVSAGRNLENSQKIEASTDSVETHRRSCGACGEHF